MQHPHDATDVRHKPVKDGVMGALSTLGLLAGI